MKRYIGLFLLLLCASMAIASPLGSSAKNAIPKQIQQIISVDYRSLKNSQTAMAMKERLLPDNLKQFETSLRNIGISPDTDLDQLTFATFRVDKSLRMVGIAQGNFPTKKIMQKLKVAKIKPLKVRTNSVWPMAGGMQMVFLDPTTLLFAEPGSLQAALATYDGEGENLAYNREITDLVSSVDNSAVWSVLDQQGTQNLMRSALGDAAKLADYELLKKRLLASRYTMDFGSGINFDLDVVTSDSLTATTLSSLVKAGVMYRRMSGNSAEKLALENVTVDSDSDRLRLHFRADEKKFQSLLNTDLFAAVTR